MVLVNQNIFTLHEKGSWNPNFPTHKGVRVLQSQCFQMVRGALAFPPDVGMLPCSLFLWLPSCVLKNFPVQVSSLLTLSSCPFAMRPELGSEGWPCLSGSLPGPHHSPSPAGLSHHSFLLDLWFQTLPAQHCCINQSLLSSSLSEGRKKHSGVLDLLSLWFFICCCCLSFSAHI